MRDVRRHRIRIPGMWIFDGEYWIVDDVQQLIDQKRVQYWAPIARIPKEDR